MRRDAIRRFLLARESPLATLNFLSDKFIPQVVTDLNSAYTRRLMALYGGDRIPQNERNLTDVRNRISLLIEYKLAWISNKFLVSQGIDDLFWANVVANRFPDLELRDNQGTRGIRVEVKCLQAIAEEKAANFDTLKKDLNPNTDYVIVFVWEWSTDYDDVTWDRAPTILRPFIFHASSLAELRDYNWLDTPPNTLGDGYQGFDFRYAVNCRKGSYSEEGGNYGKFMRIWNEDNVYRQTLGGILESTIASYLEFREFVVWSGFKVIALEALSKIASKEPEAIIIDDRVAGYFAGNQAILFSGRANEKQQKERMYMVDSQQQKAFGFDQQWSEIVVMNEKYKWTRKRIVHGKLEIIERGPKPKHLIRYLSGN